METFSQAELNTSFVVDKKQSGGDATKLTADFPLGI